MVPGYELGACSASFPREAVAEAVAKMPLLGRLSALASPATGVCGARNASRAPPPHVLLPLTAPVKAAWSHHSHRAPACSRPRRRRRHVQRPRVQLSEFFTASKPTLKLSKSQGLNCVSVLIVPRCGRRRRILKVKTSGSLSRDFARFL